MDASELREWIALFLMDLVSDGQGGGIETIPAGLAPDRPAKVAMPSATGVMAGDQLADRARYSVTIRYEPGVTTAYRVLWRDSYMDVVSVRNLDHMDTWLQLDCVRREAGAQ